MSVPRKWLISQKMNEAQKRWARNNSSDIHGFIPVNVALYAIEEKFRKGEKDGVANIVFKKLEYC